MKLTQSNKVTTQKKLNYHKRVKDQLRKPMATLSCDSFPEFLQNSLVVLIPLGTQDILKPMAVRMS